MLDSHQHVRTVGGHRSYRRDSAKEQYAIGARIGDIRKLLEYLADLGNGANQGGTQVASKLIFNARRAFLLRFFVRRTSECRQPLAPKSRQPRLARDDSGQLVPRMVWCYILVLWLRFPRRVLAG